MTDHSCGAVVAVVDDDPSILKSLEYLLESAEYSVLAFASATAMLESGCLAKIDCLISDIDMPDMDGFELLNRVHEARPELPILLVTGHPEMLDRLPPMHAHHRGLFNKPFDGRELLMAISAAIPRSRSHTPLS